MADIGFLSWLKTQHTRDDAIGDLATDVRSDAALRYKRHNANQLKHHMERMGACLNAIMAVDMANAEYRSEQEA